jgi:hypothetical protein
MDGGQIFEQAFFQYRPQPEQRTSAAAVQGAKGFKKLLLRYGWSKHNLPGFHRTEPGFILRKYSLHIGCAASGRPDYENRLPYILLPVSRKENVIKKETNPTCYLCKTIEKSYANKRKKPLWREPGMRATGLKD